MTNYVDRIVAKSRFRDFFSMVNALLVAADGDLEFVNQCIDFVNKAHAKSMSEMELRFSTVPRDCRKPTHLPFKPLKIVGAFKRGARVHVLYGIADRDDVGAFPVVSG